MDSSNAAMRELIEAMEARGLSAKTIVNYTGVVKLVVASAVDANGDQIYPPKWNHDFIGLRIIEPHKQHRPTVTKAEVEEIFPLLASGGACSSLCWPRVTEDLTKLWLGHSKRTVTDLHASGLEKEAWRRESRERAGLGFSLDGLQKAAEADSVSSLNPTWGRD
jgi:hypothetical protein